MLNSFIEILTALGWTLFNCIWAFSLLFLLHLMVTKALGWSNYNQLKYVSNYLLVCTFGVIATYLIYSELSNSTGDLRRLAYSIPSPTTFSGTEIFDFLATLIIPNLPLFALLWFTGVIALLCIMFRNAFLIKKLIQNSKTINDQTIYNSSKKISALYGLKDPIKIRESADIFSPCVAGLLKPIVLIPKDFTSSLSNKSVESILAHEIAHIARKDHLTAFVIQLVSIFLFFHPVVLRLKKELSETREYICDELSAKRVVDNRSMAIAIANLSINAFSKQTYQSSLLKAVSSKTQVEMRIEQLTGQSPKINSNFFLSTLISGFIVFMAANIACSNNSINSSGLITILSSKQNTSICSTEPH